MTWTDTELWKRTLGDETGSDTERSARESLRTVYRDFRDKAEILAARIEADVPDLTDHSVKHLDALWDVASTLADGVPLNPLEAFVFGGAVLLHDLANCLAAFPEGLEGLKGPAWDDLIYTHYCRHLGRPPTPEELNQPDQRFLPEILLQRFREIHAKQAVALATRPFFRQKIGMGPAESVYLLENLK